MIFSNFKWLFLEVAYKPIHIAQLVPHLPCIHGYVDACQNGIGGVWIIPTTSGHLRLIVWAIKVPLDLQQAFDDHIVTINDFEMAGVLCAWLVLECVLPSMTNVQAGILDVTTLLLSTGQNRSPHDQELWATSC